MKARRQALVELHAELRRCRRCAQMIGPVIVGTPVVSPVLQIGQAPGEREGRFGHPFAWTAGKTLFGWYRQIGIDEEAFRERVYMAAVCRCFPGKNPKGGDRLPDTGEIANCSTWLEAEIELLRPRLLIPVGKLAIQQFLSVQRLTDVIGRQYEVEINGRRVDLIPLPHPSGVSTWHRVDPGKGLLQDALARIAAHPAFREICTG